jgi:hypothetical protein
MRRILLGLLLALNNTPAVAEWTRIVRVDGEKEFTAYVDYTNIRKFGTKVKIWEIYDYKILQEDDGDKYMSVKSYEEYDCVSKRTRLLSLSLFSGNMGQGNVVYSENIVNSWQPVVQSNVGESMWKAACNNNSKKTGF